MDHFRLIIRKTCVILQSATSDSIEGREGIPRGSFSYLHEHGSGRIPRGLLQVYGLSHREDFQVISHFNESLVLFYFRNVPLQLLVNTFLVRGEVSCFGGIILKYLMGKLPALTANNERTGLYVKLFKVGYFFRPEE